MNNFNKRYIIYYALLFCLSFVLYYSLENHSVFIGDDLRYTFSFIDGKRIDSIGSAFESQCYHYLTHTGRFIIHFCEQICLGLIGTHTIVVLNSFLFSLFIPAFCYLVEYGKKTKLFWVLPFSLMTLLLFLPSPRVGILGNASFSFNYLWPSVFSIPLFFLFRSDYFFRTVSSVKVWLICLYLCILGSLQESFTIGYIAGFTFFLFINRRKISKKVLLFYFSFLIGALVLIGAPGNYVRLLSSDTNNSTSLIFSVISRSVQVLLDAKITVIFIVIFCIGHFSSCDNWQFIKKNSIFITSALANLLFAAIITYTGGHQLICVELISLFLLLDYLHEFRFFSNKLCEISLSIVSAIILVMLYCPILSKRVALKSSYDNMITAALVRHDSILISGDFDRCNYQDRGWVNCNYVQNIADQDLSLDLLSKSLSDETIDIRFTLMLPKPKQVLIEECIDKNESFDNIYYSGDYYYIIKLPIGNNYSKVTISVDPSWLGKLKLKLFQAGTEGVVQSVKQLDLLNHFTSQSFIFYIVPFYDNHPIVNLELN